MSSLRILCQDSPQRSVALVTGEHALIFQHHYSTDAASSIHYNSNEPPRCQVEFSDLSSVDLKNYRFLGHGYGTLGLINLNEDVFLCVVTGFSRAATVRPGETVLKIDNVDFFCLNRPDYEEALDYEYGVENEEDYYNISGLGNEDREFEYPFLALKKLLSDGSFYYSLDFNLTDRLQDRTEKSAAFDIGTLNEDMLWNSYMINSLLVFRSNLTVSDKKSLDASKILTCVIRGYAHTLTIPASVSVLPQVQTNLPSALTIISRQQSRRAGTRFNSRGIDDDGNVANSVETETILWVPSGITFSYVQIRGSVPVFWEQAPGFLPGQQKIDITRSTEATQHAFDKHFGNIELEYGAVHVVNLLSVLKSGESDLSTKFREHIRRRLKKKESIDNMSDHALLRLTEFDFHAETKGPLGYGASGQIRREVQNSLQGFAYFLAEDNGGGLDSSYQDDLDRSPVILQQEGVFRTNCLDCLDRTNLVQSMLSSMALELFLYQQGASLNPDVQAKHSTIWADNGDALSKIYAGTGALKSSFTRHGKMSFAGALADARKTATRLYVNNFSDKARQETIELLLGRLANQIPVQLYDPFGDLVSQELNQRASEYSFTKSIKIWAGTFNVNGSSLSPSADLAPWIFPDTDQEGDEPMIFAVGFQEIVTLSPQQIMSTDPTTRKVWENAVKLCLNKYSKARGTPKYVLLRSGQLVGACLMIYVREDALKDIKNVEGSVKKTGLSGISGNKGGCAIRFDYSNTRLCFVTAHLAAGFANYEDRNRDYQTIECGLRFQRDRSIEDHDTVIWVGDFNYRIGLANQNVRDLLLQNDFQRLYKNDQLNLQMVAGRAFPFYFEGPISFPPTYKYDIGKDDYDTSEKARAPAWCDRVLWKGSNIYQTYYNAVGNLRFSDHRPVCAKFVCAINIIDESLKGELRQALVTEIQHGMHGTVETGIMRMGLIDSEPTQPLKSMSALPPASSDAQKWWLSDGAHAKSSVKPPGDDFAVNINRSPNPFSSSEEFDWVRISNPVSKTPEKYSDDVAQDSSAHSNIGHGSPNSRSSEKPRDRDMKTPPQIPRKPMFLVSKESRPNTASNSIRSEGDANNSSSAVNSPNNKTSQGKAGDNQKSADLLNDVEDGNISWKPLVPQ